MIWCNYIDVTDLAMQFHRRLVNYRGRVASCGDLVSPDTCTRCATSIYTVGTQLGTSHG